MALWRTKNKDELNLIAKEMAGEVSPEEFVEVYNYIMSDEEDFFTHKTAYHVADLTVARRRTDPTDSIGGVCTRNRDTRGSA